MEQTPIETLKRKEEEAWAKYYEQLELYCQKKSELEFLVQKWLDNNSELSDEELERLIDKTDIETKELKEQYERTWSEVMKYIEARENLKHSLSIVRFGLGVGPDDIVETGYMAGKRANEVVLTGRYKTTEELKLERQAALEDIRKKVANKEISLARASELKASVEHAYGAYIGQTQELNNERQR